MSDILSIKNLSVVYKTSNRETSALKSININFRSHEIAAIVGESGSGKSTMGLAIMKLISDPGKITSGEVIYHGDQDIDIMGLDAGELRRFRWKTISMVFQASMNSLNPVTRVRDQFMDTFAAHSMKQDDKMIDFLLEHSGLSNNVKNMYPNQLSGGMKQRVNIALALACNPKILIADEPTTALDVVVQREILEYLASLKNKLNLTIIFITHDISLASMVADRMFIFYDGRVIESGDTEEIINNPLHPYTKKLLSLIISLKSVNNLKFYMPDKKNYNKSNSGCSYYNNCPIRSSACLKYDYHEIINNNHMVKCINVDKVINNV